MYLHPGQIKRDGRDRDDNTCLWIFWTIRNFKKITRSKKVKNQNKEKRLLHKDFGFNPQICNLLLFILNTTD
jgi:hypothetical protein